MFMLSHVYVAQHYSLLLWFFVGLGGDIYHNVLYIYPSVRCNYFAIVQKMISSEKYPWTKLPCAMKSVSEKLYSFEL